ncbi:hypothetical protein MCOR25_006902 [Pyricularia grisea]|nr:hypothetical protein MCOR25_006902 [Pyricularia grisea]
MASALTRVGLPTRRRHTPANVILGAQETTGEDEKPLGNKIREFSEDWDEIEDVGDFFVDRLWPQLESDYQDMLVEAKRFLLLQLSKDRNVSGVASFVRARVKTAESIRKSIQRRSTNDCFQKVPGKDVVRHELLRYDSTEGMSEFGAYEAYNHHVHLPDGYEVSRFTNVMLEIQITTVGEALFNILDHDINYKGCAGPLSAEQRAWLDSLKSAAKQVGLAMAQLTGRGHQESKLGEIYQLMCKMASGLKEKPRSNLLSSFTDELRSLVPDGHGASEKEREKLVQSFRFPDLNRRRNMISETCPETYQWIFKRADQIKAQEMTDVYSESPCWPSFSDWIKSETCFFWISGKAGSGKSTLMNFILKSTRTRELLDQWKSGAVIISHFFWRAGSTLENSLMGMFCSLVYQLADQNTYVQNLIMARVSNWKKQQNPSDWNPGELSSLLDTIFTKSPCPIFVLIDGLDEISERKDRLDLMKALERFRGLRNVKVCVSSRPERFFEESFKNEQQLRLHDLTKGDMEKEASEILKDWSKKYEEQKVADLRKTLVCKAEGVFLWLHLAGLRLKEGFHRGDTMSELEQLLKALPVELHGLYEEMWLRVNEDKKSKQIGAHYINIMVQWNHIENISEYPVLLVAAAATFSGRQLLLDGSKAAFDLRIFLAHHEEVQRCIKNRCAGIFQVTKMDWIRNRVSFAGMDSLRDLEVHPIHRSVFDFFVDTEEGLKIRDFDTCSHDQTVTDILEGFLYLKYFRLVRDSTPLEKAVRIISQHTHIPRDLLGKYARLLEPLSPPKPDFSAHLLSWVLFRRHMNDYPEDEQSDSQHVQQCVQNCIQQCKQPKALASWISRETIGHQDKDLRDMLQGQGADIWARGVAGCNSESWRERRGEFSKDVVIYASAGALELFNIWTYGLPDKSEDKFEPLNFTTVDFEPGECIPFEFSYTETWSYLEGRGGPLLNEVEVCVDITLKLNLAFLAKLRKPWGFLSESFLSKASSVPSSVSLLLVEYNTGYNEDRVFLAPSDEHISDLLAEEIMRTPMPSRHDGPSTGPKAIRDSTLGTRKLIRDFFQRSNDQFEYIAGPRQHWLARHDCGYRMVKDLEPWERDELGMCFEGHFGLL